MNNTEKAIMDAAKRMLRGKIDIQEVAEMLDVSVEKLQPLKDEIDNEMKKVFGNMNAYDMESGEVLFDTFDDLGEDTDITEFEEDE